MLKWGLVFLAGALAAFPGTVAGQEGNAIPDPALAALREGLAAETLALIDEIEQWAQADLDADPKGTYAALLELEGRATPDGRIPAYWLGELYTLVATGAFGVQDYDASAAWMERAAAQYALAGDRRDKLAQTQNNRATVLRHTGRLAEAEVAARDALQIRRELFGPVSEEIASSLHTLANVLFSQGRYHEAIELMRESVVQQEAAAPEDWPRMVLRLDGLSSILNEAGYDVESIEVARRAVDMAREHLGPDHSLYSLALNSLGINLLAGSLHQEAIPVLRESLRLRARTYGPEHPWTAASMMVLAVALEETGALEEAAALNASAAEILLANPQYIDTGTLAGLYISIARIAAAQGDWETYDARMAEGFAVVDAKLADDHPARAWMHVRHAYILDQRGRSAEALPIAERWVPVLTASHADSSNERLLGEMLLARLRQEAGMPVDTWQPLARDAASRFERLLTDPTSDDRLLGRLARGGGALARLYMAIALSSSDDAEVFRAMQLGGMSDLALGLVRSAMVENASRAGNGAGSAHAGLLALVREEAELEGRRAKLLQGGDSEALSEVERQLATTKEARIAAGEQLAAQHPGYLELVRPEPLNLLAVQSRLGPGVVLLMPFAAGDETVMLVITASSVRHHTVPTTALDGHIGAIRTSVDPADGGAPGAFPLADAHALYTMLFPGGVPPGSRILLYGGQSLASLPLSLLVTAPYDGPLEDAPWLLRDASVQVVGSLALLGRNGDAGVPDLARFAGIGGASFPDTEPHAGAPKVAGLFRSGRPDAQAIADLPPLPEAAGELRAIAAALGDPADAGGNLLLVGADAAEERLKRTDFSGYSVIAFATHGLVAGEVRGLWEPALLVGTAEGSGEDGLLGASEIARMQLDADLVILSACNTAAGLDGQAPVYSGLATAFAQAGARRLMLSHWRVRDDAAARLTVGTVRGMAAGADGPAALRAAQLELMADPGVPGAAHPAIWAPFVIVQS